jgi:hypothetical protein
MGMKYPFSGFFIGLLMPCFVLTRIIVYQNDIDRYNIFLKKAIDNFDNFLGRIIETSREVLELGAKLKEDLYFL